jgi:hypothetical protein
MDRLAWCAPDSTDWETLWRLLRRAIIASSDTLLNDLHLPIESGSATFDQRNIRSQTHLVHMSSGLQVIQSVKNHGKAFEPVHIVMGVLDVGMVSLELHIRVEFMRRLLSHLYPIVSVDCDLVCLSNPPKPSTF